MDDRLRINATAMVITIPALLDFLLFIFLRDKERKGHGGHATDKWPSSPSYRYRARAKRMGAKSTMVDTGHVDAFSPPFNDFLNELLKLPSSSRLTSVTDWETLVEPIQPDDSTDGPIPFAASLGPSGLIDYFRSGNPVLSDEQVRKLARDAWLQQSSTQEAQSFGWIASECTREKGNKDCGKEAGWWEARRPRYAGLGFPRSLDVWDGRCGGLPKSEWPMTRTDFIAGMEFVASLTAVENVGRVMDLPRAARLGEWSTAAARLVGRPF
jgi:hypothetical protein